MTSEKTTDREEQIYSIIQAWRRHEGLSREPMTRTPDMNEVLHKHYRSGFADGLAHALELLGEKLDYNYC